MSLIQSDWYNLLVDDCKSILTEAVYRSRLELLEGYHQLGKRITEDVNWQKHSKGNGSCLTDLSNNTGIGERDLYRAIQFYNKFPDVEQVYELPEGKNISWSKVVNNYLPSTKEVIDPLTRLKQELLKKAREILHHDITPVQRAKVNGVIAAFEEQ